MNNTNFCKANSNFLLIPLILLNVATLALLVSAFFVEDWVFQDLDNEFEWSGSLLEVESGFSSGRDYSEISDDYCNSEETTAQDLLQSEAICSIFSDLEESGNVLFITGIISSTGLLLNLMIILPFFCKSNCMGYSYFTSFCSLISIAIGLVYYMIVPNLSFDDCSEGISDGSEGDICVDLGVYLALAAGGSMVIFVIYNFVITYNLFNKLKIFRPIIQSDKPQDPVIRVSNERLSRNQRPQSEIQVIRKEIVIASSSSYREEDGERSKEDTDEEEEKEELSLSYK